jgi:urease accessory protein
MIVVNRVTGNIFSASRKSSKARFTGNGDAIERIFLSREEMGKVRLRRKTDRGTDIGLVLEQGQKLRHGDILDVEGKYVVVEQVPEKVISILIGKGDTVEKLHKAALIGHTIGNRHRPLAIDGDKISFPLQSDSEIELFEKLLPAGVKLTVTREIFVPASEVVHHHE